MSSSGRTPGGGVLPRRLALCAIIGVILSAAQSTRAATDGSRLYAPCGVCHQPGAGGSPDGTIPGLAGQRRSYLGKQLAMFRSGARVDTAMQIVTAHTSKGTQVETAALAGYLSGLPPNPHPVTGPGEHLRLGQELYSHICAGCHAIDGSGDADHSTPRLAGQHYPYLRHQIETAADLHKDIAPPEMTSALRGMRPPELDALADYISRLGRSEAVLETGNPLAR